jgi:hypothetical protein
MKATTRTFLIVLAMATILATITTGAAIAGKAAGHKQSGGGTISLVLVNSTDGLPHFGQQVTFNISATFSEPWVNLRCYQKGTWVSGEWGGFFDGSAYDQIFTLGPSNSWAGGDADCTADLVEWTARGSLVVKASTSFQVYA